MKAVDFEYDGLKLSDLGYIICEFDSEGLQTVSGGSQINFNTVSTRNGAKHELSGSGYNECLETVFRICKNPEQYNESEKEITFNETRELMKWLNRKGYHKFKLLADEYADIYFEASFNVSRLELGGKIIGLELNMVTNRPFALREPITITINNTLADGTASITSISDEEGYLYPHTEITIAESGNLSIYNALEDRTTYIADCTAGEIITLDYPVIESSLSAHKIQNAFNWNFFRIANTFQNHVNALTISIPCTIVMTYSPVVKTGI